MLALRIIILGMVLALDVGALLAQDAPLTPQQRVDTIARLTKPATPTTIPADTTFISGQVRMPNNEPLPSDLELTLNFSPPRTIPITPNADGTFSTRQPRTTLISANVWAPGYAAQHVQVLRPSPDGSYTVPTITLDKGFTAHLKVIDDKGAPLANATILYFFGRAHLATKTTDASGMIEIPNASNSVPSGIRVWEKGFQYQFLFNKPGPDAPLNVRLSPAALSEGLVTDEATDNPIPGATFKLLRLQGGFYSEDLSVAQLVPDFATTDANGHFILDFLPDNSHSAFVISAPGHSSKVVENLTPNQLNLRISLAPERVVHISVKGDLSRLDSRVRPDGTREPVIAYADALSATSFLLPTLTFPLPGRIENNIALFDLNDPCPTTKLFLADRYVVLPGTGDTFSIDLADPQFAPPSSRTVRFVFNVPKGEPLPTGTLTFQYADPTRPDGNVTAGNSRTKTIPITNGIATCEVPTPTRLRWTNETYLPGFLAVNPWRDNFGNATTPPVPTAPEASEIQVQTLPAGLIRGKVFNADKSPLNDPYYSLSIIETGAHANNRPNRPPGLDERSSGLVRNPGEFLCPLPLGISFSLLLRSGTHAALSPEFLLTDSNPIQTLDLQLSDSETAIRGRIYYPSGKPFANQTIAVTWISPWNTSSIAQTTTDADGRFTFTLNPDLPGTFEIRLSPNADYPGQKILVTPGTPIDYHIPEGLPFHGIIINAVTNKPIPGATIYLYNKADPSQGTGYVTADEQGAFRFNNLPAEGTFVVQVTNAATEGATFTLNPATKGFTIRGGKPWPVVSPGNAEPFLVRVQPYPDRNAPILP